MHNHLHMRTAEFQDAKCMSQMPCRLIYDSQTNLSHRHFRHFTTITLTYPFPLSSAPFPRIEAPRIRGCPQPNVHEFPTSNPRLRWKLEIAVCNLSQSDVEGSLDGWDTFNRRQHTKVTMGCWAQWRRICRLGIRVVYTTSTKRKQLPNIDHCRIVSRRELRCSNLPIRFRPLNNIQYLTCLLHVLIYLYCIFDG